MGETAVLGVLTHGLEHLGGDAGAFADEAEHDLFDELGGGVSASREALGGPRGRTTHRA